jgi:recombination protein RecA
MSELPTQKDKLKSLSLLSKTMEREFKTPVLLRLGEKVGTPVDHLPTGLASLDDDALGIGGLPKGRVIEIFGPEASSKTTMALQVIAETQKNGGTAALVDAEHALDPTWASKIGVDVDNMFVCQPDSAEQALQVTDRLVESNAVDLVVVDSVAALVPRAELEGDIGDAHVGLLARLMAQSLRILTGRLNKGQSRTSIIFINQIREKIGVMFGSNETQPGGRALKFYASIRMDVRKREYIGKQGEAPIGAKIRVKIIKNKMAPPFKETFLDLYFGNEGHEAGFDKAGSALDLAFARELITKEGNTYSLNGQKVAVGLDATKQAIRDNPELLAIVQELIKKGK